MSVPDVHDADGASGARTPWGRLSADLGGALRARIEDVVDEVADGVAAATPAFATIEDPKFRRDLHEGVAVAVGRFLELVGTDDDALTPQVREVFVGLGAAEARDDREPEVLMAALRVSARLLLRAGTTALEGRRRVTTGEVVALADASIAFVDELAAASMSGFTTGVRELAGEHDRVRRRLAELLLGGGATQGVVDAAAASAGWAALDRVLPVLLPSGEARDARFRFRTDGLVVERTDHVVAVLRAEPRTTRAQLLVRLRGRGAVVGPTVAWPDLPASSRLAGLTSRLAIEGGSPEPVFVEDHLATLALRGEPSALAVLTRRRLAPFDDIPPSQREQLLTTLGSWLRHWGARSAVAAELYIHPQTVSHRIRRVRRLLGDDLDDPSVRFELALVLADDL